jgi:hypothetical protein
MTRELVTATARDGTRGRYLLEVIEEGDHWTSTLARVTVDGGLDTTRVAPRFYGLTHDQARRRMLTVLENDYDDVTIGPANGGA